MDDAIYRAYIEAMALTTQLEEIPTVSQLKKVIHWATLKRLEGYFIARHTTLQAVCMEVSKDVARAMSSRAKDSARHQRYRDSLENVTRDVTRDVPGESRVEKRREYNIIEENIIKENNTITHTAKSFLVEFEKLWEKYPRRERKKDAVRHFNASVKAEKDLIDIANALDNYLEKINVEKTEPKYIQQGGTWFNNWRDWIDYDVPEAKGSFSRTLEFVQEQMRRMDEEEGITYGH